MRHKVNFDSNQFISHFFLFFKPCITQCWCAMVCMQLCYPHFLNFVEHKFVGLIAALILFVIIVLSYFMVSFLAFG